MAQCCLQLVAIVVSLSATVLAGTTQAGDDNDGGTQTYIVRVQNDLKPTAYGDVENWYTSTLQGLSHSLEYSSDDATSGRPHVVHVYRTVFHGFAATLSQQQVEELKVLPSVLGVFPDRILQLHTTRSPEFLGLTSSNTAVIAESDSGANVIIGLLDTGIWPDRRSFNDEGLGPVPSRWKGECTEGQNFTKALCNKKLIGARYFTAGYDASVRAQRQSDVKSAIDSDGHGTHTASTAAGRPVAGASFLGYAQGVATGVASKARIAMYKVCWSVGCLSSDILAAFDKAVEDGVDVISASLGYGGSPYDIDPVAIGAFAAMERGVLVSASAGNQGPQESTIFNVAPWITTVGASTIDRSFPATLVLEGGGNITGASLYAGSPLPDNTFFTLIYAGNASKSGADGDYMAVTCSAESLDPTRVRGKIVLCMRGGGFSRAAKSKYVAEAGGVGMVLANNAPLGDGLIADAFVLPALSVGETAGYQIQGYISNSKNPRARIVFGGTQLGVKPAPVVASFQSRGPNSQSLYVIKPDVIAPGVNILAAWSGLASPGGIPGDARRPEFNIMSGTSMSCPHVSGLAALLKGAHPDWSPAMVRSALMTTAYTRDAENSPLLDETWHTQATVWDIGAGHVDPVRAVDPGLVYDLTATDYLNFLCASGYNATDLTSITPRPVTCPIPPMKLWDLNYPAISVVFDAALASNLEKATVWRTVTHVGDGAATYTVAVSNPKGAVVAVDPEKLVFGKKGETRRYAVSVSANKVDVPAGNTQTESGLLTWTDGKHRVTSPVAVVWQRAF